MSHLTLYMSPFSSSLAVHIALHEIGVPFDTKLVSVSRKETTEPAYLAVNPEGKVPLLIAGSQKISEVAGILWYLARRFPDAKLLPSDDIDIEAQIVSWMSFVASMLHPARHGDKDSATTIYLLAEHRLGPNHWAAGNAYSIADIHLFRLYWRFSDVFKFDRERFPNLEAHRARMLARPAVIKTLEIEKAMV